MPASDVPRPKALVTGITGQDGSYLAELLLSKGYEVWGVIRRSSSFNTKRINHLYQDPHEPGVRLRLCYGDLTDASSINQILKQVRPDEIYNLGAQSHVKVSFEIPEYIHSRLQPQILLDFPEHDEELLILRENLPFADEQVLAYVVGFLQRAHKADESYTVRDGINVARYALKLGRRAPERGPRESMTDLVARAVRMILGEEAVGYMGGG